MAPYLPYVPFSLEREIEIIASLCSGRMRAAIACLPFERPRFAVVAQTTTEDLTVRMQQALEARMNVVNARATEVKELPKPVE